MPGPSSVYPHSLPAQFYNVQDYGAVPDAFFTDGVSNGTTTFTSSTANFTQADVGNYIVILRAGSSSAQDHHTTIASVQSATSVTLTNATGRSQTPCRFYVSRSGGQAAAIQAAINACSTAGGGVVFCPGVGYLIDATLVLKNRVWLEGAGMRATMLHLAANVNAPVITNDLTSDNTGEFVAVRNLWVDGNRVRQSDTTTTLSAQYTVGGNSLSLTNSASFLPSGECLIGSCRFVYQTNSANSLTGASGGMEGTTDATQTNGSTVTQHKSIGIYFATVPFNVGQANAENYDPHYLVENVHVKNCKGEGVFISGMSEARIENVWANYCDHASFRPSYDTMLSNCTSDTGGRMGFYFRWSSTLAINCKSFFSGGNTASDGHGFLVEGPTAIEEGERLLVGCTAQDNKAHGYYVRNAERVRIDGQASTNSTSSAGTYVGLCIDGSKHGIFDLDSTDRTQGTATQQSSLQLLETNGITNDGLKIRLTQGFASGVSGGSTPVKSGSVWTGAVDLSVNGMGGYRAVTLKTTTSASLVSIATPAVFSWTGHGLQVNDAIILSTTGALPTGLTAGTVYYVIAAGLTANAFEVSTSKGGAAVNTSGTQSGNQTATQANHYPDPYLSTVSDITTALPIPYIIEAPANAHLGAEIEINLLQDGTGGRAITWDATYTQTPAYADTGNTAGKRYRARFRYNGSNWVLLWRSQSATAGTYWS